MGRWSGAPGTTVYTAPHSSGSCGGERHVDVYTTDTSGHTTKSHSTDSRDIRAGEVLSNAMSNYRSSGGGKDKK